MIIRVVAAMSRRKRKMNMTLQQWYVFLKPLLCTKLLIILLLVKHLWAWQTTFWTWNCCCFIWYV